MDVTLILVDGKASRRDVKLTLPAVIGRSRDAELALGHPRISRQHCELFERDGALVVRDCDSLNGTFVDNRRINEAVVKPGDRITVGPLTFVAVYEHPGEGDELTEGLVAITGVPEEEPPPELPPPVGEDELQFDVDVPGDEADSDADTAERLGPKLSDTGAPEEEPPPELPPPVGEDELQFDVDAPGDEADSGADTAERLGPKLSDETERPATAPPMPILPTPAAGPEPEAADKTLNTAAEQTIHDAPGDSAEPAGADAAGGEDAGDEDAGDEDAGAEDARAEDGGAEDGGSDDSALADFLRDLQ